MKTNIWHNISTIFFYHYIIPYLSSTLFIFGGSCCFSILGSLFLFCLIRGSSKFWRQNISVTNFGASLLKMKSPFDLKAFHTNQRFIFLRYWLLLSVILVQLGCLLLKHMVTFSPSEIRCDPMAWSSVWRKSAQTTDDNLLSTVDSSERLTQEDRAGHAGSVQSERLELHSSQSGLLDNRGALLSVRCWCHPPQTHFWNPV